MSKPTEDALEPLFTAVVNELLNRIKTGKAQSSDIGNAIKLLKDNGITCDPAENEPMSLLAEVLPFADTSN